MFVKLLLLALAGSAAAAPTLDRSHDQQPIWQHKVLHAWFCNHHPNSRWCQARGSPPAPPPTLSPELLGGVACFDATCCDAKGNKRPCTPFQPRFNEDLKDAFTSWCAASVNSPDGLPGEQSPVMEKYGDIALWDVSFIIDMSNLFDFVVNRPWCNPDISKWDTGNVISMNSMFSGAASFNADLSKWDTRNVADMQSMFDGATAFSADLSRWNTGSVTNMDKMFNQAIAFTNPKFCPQRFWFWPRVPLVCPSQPGA